MDKNKRVIIISLIAVLCFAIGFTSAIGIGVIKNRREKSDNDKTNTNSYQEEDNGIFFDSEHTTGDRELKPKNDGQTDNSGSTDSQQNVPTNLSPEGKYVQPSGEEWNLKLVNNWNTMSQSETDSIPITAFRDTESCDSRIQSQLEAMLTAGSQYGLWVTSSYRSYSDQQVLFENKINRVIAAQGCTREEAEKIAATEVARPGTSEHNTGLAVDLLNNECNELEVYWENTKAFTWLQEHCAEYGFILRYPKGKEHITGITYEPWHYRYVGVEAATEIMDNGLCLEEYLEKHGK